LLGDVTAIAGWVFGGYLLFKIIILLSATGSILYGFKILIDFLRSYGEKSLDVKEHSHEIKSRPVVNDMKIGRMTITDDGTYEDVIETLNIVRKHVNTAGGSYIHIQGADWLRSAVKAKIASEKPQGDE